MIRILVGDAVEQLRMLEAESVHCAVTSPPYYNLRSYLDAGHPDKALEIGGEATPAEWCMRLVEVFREVKRVLRSDGLLWLNCGSSFAGAGTVGHKPGDLMILPVMLAEALRADGWWLRDASIWAKDSCMPESVAGWRWEQHRIKVEGEWVECPGCPKCLPNDGLVLRKGSWRHTQSYEYVFQLAKSAEYFADGEGVRESDLGTDHRRHVVEPVDRANGHLSPDFGIRTAAGRNGTGRNPRNVWRLSAEPLGAIEVDGEDVDHFAAFPRALVRRCLLASTSAKGCCPSCGVPWARVVERDGMSGLKRANGSVYTGAAYSTPQSAPRGPKSNFGEVSIQTHGWRPTCACAAGDPAPATILDCFAGSGTVGVVAQEMGLDAVLVELSPEYAAMAKARIEQARAKRALGDVERVVALPGQMSLL